MKIDDNEGPLRVLLEQLLIENPDVPKQVVSTIEDMILAGDNEHARDLILSWVVAGANDRSDSAEEAARG
jgi:hypothetical protein